MYALILALFFQTSADSIPVRVSFHVHTAGIVARDTVHIIGNHRELGLWDHSNSLRLERSNEGHWRGTVSLPRGGDIAFKVTRGSWASEAVTADGYIPPDTWIHIDADTTISLSVDRWKDDTVEPIQRRTGTVFLHEDFPSPELGASRNVWVIVPSSYESAVSKRYPVLYIQDGQNAFDARLSFSGTEWGIDETADSLAEAGIIPEIIIVAVASTSQRIHEYADTTRGRLYARFMAEEIKPFIDSGYRTMPGREHTAVMGSSMGALISFLMAWWYPEIYGQVACLSPAFLWGDEAVLHRVADESTPHPRPRIYLDVGDQGIEQELQPGTNQMSELLVSKGWIRGKDMLCIQCAGAGHDEGSWASRLEQILAFLHAPEIDISEFMKGETCE